MKLQEAERAMLEKGYASPRMAGKKTSRTAAAIRLMATEERVESINVGRRLYVKIESLKKYLGPDAVKIYKLNDWSDIEDEN